jgi:hypothetical protein
MFAGFTSRWIVPRACAKSSAAPMSESTASASSAGRGPPRAIRSARLSPGMNRIAMYARPPTSPAS